MTLDIGRHTLLALLIIGTGFCTAAAEAAGGYSITQNEESRVVVGMTEADVRQALGPPARTRDYRYTPGPSWAYAVQAAPFGRTDFNVYFGADGKVISMGEYLYGSSH